MSVQNVVHEFTEFKLFTDSLRVGKAHKQAKMLRENLHRII